MMAARGGLWLLLAVASGRAVATPVDKVVSLLTKLTAQVQSEGVAEAASYDKYACFCKEQADDKVYVIAKSDKQIKELDADITDLDENIKSLDLAVSKRKKDVEAEEKKQVDNKKIRTGEQEEYAKNRADLQGAVDAVQGALETMENSKKDVDEELSSLLQKLPSRSRSMVPGLALIADAVAGKKYGAPPGKAAAYEYSSKEVIQTLNTLMMTFKGELADLDEAEIRTRSDFGMAAGARRNTITALEKEIDEKSALSASKGEEKSDQEELKAQETTARNADQAFLDDLTSKCSAKASAWDQRSTTRAGELTALTQAVALLKGMGDKYNSNSKLVGLISKDSRPSVAKHTPTFLQLQSKRRLNVDKDKLQRLVSRLSQEAHSLKSTPLAVLALQLKAAGPDHFVKVRGIIKDLISKLVADAKAEATSKSLCDKSMLAAVDKRDKSNAASETARARIDTTEVHINTLKTEIADLAKNIADLNGELKEATELRAGEKADNVKTIADADSGKDSVDQAITLLNKFYGNSLLQAYTQKPHIKDSKGQTVGDLAPDTFSSDEEYKGNVDSSKGIIGMLEVISSDFERTSKTVTLAEADALKDFNTIKDDTDQAIKDKAKLKKTKETDVETDGSSLTGFKDDLKDATTMNEEALEELDKLHASCVAGEETYAERVQHRKDEIEALKDALDIFEEWQSS